LVEQVLVFANGDVGDGPMARRVLDEARNVFVLAADGGARVAQHFGRKIDLIIGDMDSLSAGELEYYQSQRAEIERHPPEKDATDLELALQWVAQNKAGWVRVFGGIGGRLDQTISNIYLLALPALRDVDVRFVSGLQAAWIIYPGENIIQGTVGDTVSLIPLSGAASGIRTENLYYPLKNEMLSFGPARGISNVMTADHARVWFQDGLLLVVQTISRA
jgi:thiamine pyrophosphokinase